MKSEFASKIVIRPIWKKHISQYCHKMLDIASINMKISAVIQYIDGINNEVNKTILYGAKTISQLKIVRINES